ncbi:hypothetical protein BD779DRAFT_1675587 [Infundibulicybe gibba]|nr:hypothetical protein BD779DRAFT_1675587 [Infundibulicybe gibba]
MILCGKTASGCAASRRPLEKSSKPNQAYPTVPRATVASPFLRGTIPLPEARLPGTSSFSLGRAPHTQVRGKASDASRLSKALRRSPSSPWESGLAKLGARLEILVPKGLPTFLARSRTFNSNTRRESIPSSTQAPCGPTTQGNAARTSRDRMGYRKRTKTTPSGVKKATLPDYPNQPRPRRKGLPPVTLSNAFASLAPVRPRRTRPNATQLHQPTAQGAQTSPPLPKPSTAKSSALLREDMAAISRPRTSTKTDAPPTRAKANRSCLQSPPPPPTETAHPRGLHDPPRQAQTQHRQIEQLNPQDGAIHTKYHRIDQPIYRRKPDRGEERRHAQSTQANTADSHRAGPTTTTTRPTS